MGHIEPTDEQLAALAGLPADEPLVMLNLLRFRTECAGDSVGAGMTGEDAYRRYGDGVGALEPPFAGEAQQIASGKTTVIGPHDERWDLMLLVRYASPQAFIDAVTRPDYREIAVWRTAALDDSRLIAFGAS